MIATFRVQHFDDSNLTEFVTYERTGIYHIIQMLERDPTVKAYAIIGEGRPIEDPHMTYSFGRNIEMAKYTKRTFEW